MNRRQILSVMAISAGLIWLTPGRKLWAVAEREPMSGQIKVFSVEKNAYQMVERVIRSEEEWRRLLSPAQFHILRERGTERAFSSAYHNSKQSGIYRCAACELDLYSSKDKYDSGTGWPSFYQPVAPENISTRMDRSFFMIRNELVCSRCDSHLGHVFNDGPEPTGKRHCINAVSLNFAEL